MSGQMLQRRRRLLVGLVVLLGVYVVFQKQSALFSSDRTPQQSSVLPRFHGSYQLSMTKHTSTFPLRLIGQNLFNELQKNQVRNGQAIIDNSKTNAPPIEATMTVSGYLDINSQSPRIMQLSLSNTKLDLGIETKNQQANAVDGIQHQMGFSVDVVTKANGAFQTVKFNPQCEVICQQIWSAILPELQLIEPKARDLNQWSLAENSFFGNYDAQYHRSDDRLKKTKSNYSGLGFLKNATFAASIDNMTSTTLAFDNGLIKTLDSDDTIDVSDPQGEKVYHHSNRLKLHLVASRSAPPIQVSQVAPADTAAIFSWQAGALETFAEQKAIESAWRRELGTTTLAQIRQALTQQQNKDEEVVLYKKIRAFFKFHPESCADFVDDLVKGDYNGKAHTMIAVALGRVGHTQAQATLRSAIDQRIEQNRPVRNYLALLAQSSHPSADTIHYLQQMAVLQNPDLHDSAVLALGTSLGNLATIDPDQAQTIADDYARKLKNEKNNDEKSLIIAMLGNAGLESSYQVLADIIAQEKDPELIEGAIYALRFQKSRESHALLLELTHHKNASLVSAATKSLHYHDFSQDTASRMLELANQQNEPSVRGAAIDWLWENRSQMPNVKNYLTAWSKEANALEVNRIAKQYLEFIGATAIECGYEIRSSVTLSNLYEFGKSEGF